MNAPLTLPAAEMIPVTAPAALLRFITCGSVDDGKSTLIGRLLYDTGAVPDDQLASLHADSRRFGTQGDALDLALLVDGLAAEREQGITIDVAYRYFSTPRRAFIVADTPGHEQYTRNMATGASGADLAIILVDARKGVLAQTRRHSFIVSMVGVRRVVVAINKMDLVGFDEGVFTAIANSYRAVTRHLGLDEIVFIPVSALRGDNIASLSTDTPWYRGRALIEHLETVDVSAHAADPASLRMPVQWVNRPNAHFRGFSGTIALGAAHVGQDVKILPSGRRTRIANIVTASGEDSSAQQDEAVTLVLEDEVDASRGDVIVAAQDDAPTARVFDGRLLWMSERAASAQGLLVQQGMTIANAALSIRTQIDVNTFAEQPADNLPVNGIGRVRIRSEKPLVLAAYAQDRTLGAFILIDRLTNETVALGVIDEVNPADLPKGETTFARKTPDLWRRLLAPADSSGETLAEAVSWRIVSALIVTLLAAVLTQTAWIAFLAGSADFALRLLLRAVHRDVFKRVTALRQVDPEQNADGGGI
jgi:sulfate adenylyltransferase large subunit